MDYEYRVSVSWQDISGSGDSSWQVPNPDAAVSLSEYVESVREVIGVSAVTVQRRRVSAWEDFEI